MEESELSVRQQRWLEASRRIGKGAMTRTERETLERLWAEMLPLEQQELQRYIQERFGKKEEEKRTSEDEKILDRMETRKWTAPSDALRKAFSKGQHGPDTFGRRMKPDPSDCD